MCGECAEQGVSRVSYADAINRRWKLLHVLHTARDLFCVMHDEQPYILIGQARTLKGLLTAVVVMKMLHGRIYCHADHKSAHMLLAVAVLALTCCIARCSMVVAVACVPGQVLR